MSVSAQWPSPTRDMLPPGDRAALGEAQAQATNAPASASTNLEAAARALLGPVAAAVLEVRRAVGEDLGLEPEPLEVTDLAADAVVLVGGAAVEHVEVVDELHIAGTQLHLDVVVGVVGHRHQRAE